MTEPLLENISLLIYDTSKAKNINPAQISSSLFLSPKAMASGGSKSAAYILLMLNLALYFIVTVIAAWAVNHGIQRSREAGNLRSLKTINQLKHSRIFQANGNLLL